MDLFDKPAKPLGKGKGFQSKIQGRWGSGKEEKGGEERGEKA
jgi:hypothetical protein